jgi:predicted phosphodiesterase
MKKIVIISDSHGRIDNIKKIDLIIKESDAVIFLGDNVSDILKYKKSISKPTAGCAISGVIGGGIGCANGSIMGGADGGNAAGDIGGAITGGAVANKMRADDGAASGAGAGTGLEFFIVKGNCDILSSYPQELVVELENVKLLLTHGHLYNVKKSLLNLTYRASELGCGAALFGHTHISGIEKCNGVTLINPGSIGSPRIGRESYCYMVLHNGGLTANICNVCE